MVCAVVHGPLRTLRTPNQPCTHPTLSQPQFGTPEEDAFRRDFTINSLFYNINTGLIEDFTKQ